MLFHMKTPRDPHRKSLQEKPHNHILKQSLNRRKVHYQALGDRVRNNQS
jgi:hypothetical protein